MITDQELQAIFGDSLDGSPKEKEQKKTSGRSKKSRAPKRKTKINFDPNIFLDADKNENNNDDNFDIPLFSNKRDKEEMIPEFSSLSSRINFYFSTQIKYLIQDFTNELIAMVDSTPKENKLINDFLDDVLESIKKTINFSTDQSISDAMPRNFFDFYADYFFQCFIEAEFFSQNNYETDKVRALRKNFSEFHSSIKRSLSGIPDLLQAEIADLLLAHSNYQSIRNSNEVQDQSRKKRHIYLECKKIEQQIMHETYSQLITNVKDRRNALNGKKISQNDDDISHTISNVRILIDHQKMKIDDFCSEKKENLKELKEKLKLLRIDYESQHNNSLSINTSNYNDLSNSSIYPQSNDSYSQMNNSVSYLTPYHRGNNMAQRNYRMNRNANSYNEIQKSFQMIHDEHIKDLANTTAFIENVQEGHRENLLQMLHNSMYQY